MRRKLLFSAACVFTVCLAASSLFSLDEVPVKKLSLSDKALHAIAYFLLVLVWGFVFSVFEKVSKKIRIILLLAGGAFLFGIIIEALQGVLTNYRDPDIWDAVANTTGILLAVGFILITRKVRS